MTGSSRRWIIAALVSLGALVAPANALASTAPTVVGWASNSTTLSGVDAVAVSGHYAYTTAYWTGQLTAVDISNPISPKVVGATPLPIPPASLQNGSNVTISGNYAFVVSKNRNASMSNNDDGSGNSLTIVNISNPAMPTVVGSVRDPARLFGAYGVAVSGNYAYVAYQGLLGPPQPQTPDTSSGGFTVIDISKPLSPSSIVANIDNGPVVGGHNYFYHATSVAISGHYAYVTAALDDRVTVVDISNPASPSIVTSLRDATRMPFPVDVAVSGNYAYVASQSAPLNTQLAVLNISNPARPSVVGSLSNPMLAGAYRIRVHNNFAYIAASGASAIGAVDVSNPSSPRLAGWVQNPGQLNFTTGLDLDSSGGYVIAASPHIPTENGITNVFPPFTNTTGTISAVQLDPNPIGVAISPGSEPPTVTFSTSASFSFSVNDDVSTVSCGIDGGALGPCTSATSQLYSSLSPGPHTFTVRATDAAGKTASASYSWTIYAVSSSPANTSPPTISGTPAEGDTLTASAGRWTGYPAPSFSYRWQRCDQNGTNCNDVPGASTSSYTLQRADVANKIKAIVTGTNRSGSSSASSPTTPTISGPPVTLLQPNISGTAMQGSTLRGSARGWSGYPAPALRYTWQRCNARGGSCSVIAGATARTYTATVGEVGSTLRFAVTGQNALGAAGARSAATAVVRSNAVATMTGVARGVPILQITVTAAGNGALLKQIAVTLPYAVLRFFPSKQSLAIGVTIRDRHNKLLRAKTGLRYGSLIITLGRPAAGVRIVVGGSAIEVKRSFARRANGKKKPTAMILVTVIETHGVHTHDPLLVRVR
jgi:hypothetical protein